MQPTYMPTRACPICKRPLSKNPRARYCSERCRWQAYWQRQVQRSERLQALPLSILPPDADEVLPLGSERTLLALQLVIAGRALAGAQGYRVGTRHGASSILRWFPSPQHTGLCMLRLHPFEWPAVPVAGSYAVVYLDAHAKPFGGPRFTVDIEHSDRTLYYQRLLDRQRPDDRRGAMVEAMQELRRKPGRSHLYYWAPFLVVGSDGPLH